MNLEAVDEMVARFPDVEIVFIESVVITYRQLLAPI